MTTYNAHDKSKLRSPDTPVEIGVTIITRATQEFDMGSGEWAIVPCADRRIHIKTTFGNYTEQFVLDYVREHWGRGWLVQSHNLCVSDDLHPF
ncbi:MAG: hypothetical protein AAGE84_24700 [Cyanobacteria bacterium P01_G01_bin.39]